MADRITDLPKRERKTGGSRLVGLRENLQFYFACWLRGQNFSPSERESSTTATTTTTTTTATTTG